MNSKRNNKVSSNLKYIQTDHIITENQQLFTIKAEIMLKSTGTGCLVSTA